MPLSDIAIRKAKPAIKSYKLADAGGLYLEVAPNGGKWWRWKYRRPVTRKENRLSFGTYPNITLGEARNRRDVARKLLASGIDPGEQRKAASTAAIEAATNSFEAIAREWLAIRAPGWTSVQLAKETGRLQKHAFPYIGGRPIGALGVREIRPVIDRVFKAGHLEQAHRLRFQLSRIFRYAVATERVETDPAAALSEALPSRRDMVKRRYPTITDPFKAADLLRAIDGFTGTPATAAALKLAPLWFCRPGEIRMAEWTHFDLTALHPTYTVPPANRKLKKRDKERADAAPHVIPLSRQSIEVLRELHLTTGHGRYLFPSARDQNRHMSDGTVNAALARIGFKGEMVAHGFRHMASTMLREMGWSRDAVEAQLSHAIGGTEGVYNMATHMSERREMMQAWADFLDTLRRGDYSAPKCLGIRHRLI